MATIMRHQADSQRYTFWTQLLNGLGALAASALAVWILSSPERRTDPDYVFRFVWALATIHTIEEYIWPGGFVRWFNTTAFGNVNPDFPLSARRAFFTDSLAAVMVAPLFLVPGTTALPLAFVFVMLLFQNGFFHLTETIKTGKYSPGVVTSVVLYLPGLAYITAFYLNAGLVSPVLLVVAFIVALGFNATFFAKVRGWLRSA